MSIFLSFYGTLIKFNQLLAILGAVLPLDFFAVLMGTAVQFSRIGPKKVAVLQRTAVRFSMRTYFMEHHSVG